MNHLLRIENGFLARALALYGVRASIRRAQASLDAARRAEILLCELGNRCARRGDISSMVRADCRRDALRKQLYN